LNNKATKEKPQHTKETNLQKIGLNKNKALQLLQIGGN
jgi:hypothetical protein